MKRIICFTMLVMFLLFLTAAAGAKLAPGMFMDIRWHWAESEINTAYNQGLMMGTGVNEFGYRIFSPEENVNRYQLAVVLDRAFDFDYGAVKFIKEPAAGDYFYDVKDDVWYSEAVILGTINHLFIQKDEFKGEEKVSRIETARCIWKAFQAKDISVPMNDLMPLYYDTDDLVQEDINAMVFASNTSIMKGNDNLFRPYDPLTRAELARVINQAAKLIEMNPVEPDPASGVTLEIKEVKNESQLINIDLNIPVIKGLQNEEMQTKLNLIMENDAMERQQDMMEEAESASDYILSEPCHTYEMVSRFNQYYVTGNSLSFYIDYYNYTGGAHGMTERKAYNFNLNTGEELTLSDLFAPGFDYTKMINERVEAEINRHPDCYFSGEYGFKGITDDQGFYLENDNLIVYFLQYEIAPYAAGIRTFSIPL